MNKKLLKFMIFFLIIFSIITVYLLQTKKNNEEKKEIAIVDNIEKYGYTLYDNKSEVYKNKFNELKEVLNQEEVNEEEYAQVLSELFAIDFYNLNNKVTNTDIGGLEFIHPIAKEEFTLAAKDTIYKYVESNVYGGRNQELPEVTAAEASLIENKKFESEKVSDENAYEVQVDISYKKDLEYPTNITLTIVHNENKLYIVEVK